MITVEFQNQIVRTFEDENEAICFARDMVDRPGNVTSGRSKSTSGGRVNWGQAICPWCALSQRLSAHNQRRVSHYWVCRAFLANLES